MITLTYTVECDGPHPDIEDESCEAEFVWSAAGVFSDISGLRRQKEGRGWSYIASQGFDADGRKLPGVWLCPLHWAVKAETALAAREAT